MFLLSLLGVNLTLLTDITVQAFLLPKIMGLTDLENGLKVTVQNAH